MEECPCENCVCIPICRHKLYGFLFRDCSLIKDQIPYSNDERKRNPDLLEQLEKTLNPTRWTYHWCPDIDQDHKLIVDRATLKPRWHRND
jgi:hypothetical protein